MTSPPLGKAHRRGKEDAPLLETQLVFDIDGCVRAVEVSTGIDTA